MKQRDMVHIAKLCLDYSFTFLRPVTFHDPCNECMMRLISIHLLQFVLCPTYEHLLYFHFLLFPSKKKGETKEKRTYVYLVYLLHETTRSPGSRKSKVNRMCIRNIISFVRKQRNSYWAFSGVVTFLLGKLFYNTIINNTTSIIN